MYFFKRTPRVLLIYFFKSRDEAYWFKNKCFKNNERPHDLKGIHSYLGMVNYWKHFIPDFSTLTYPLQQLTHKNTKFVWRDACEKSFNIMNNLLTDASVYTYFNEQKIFFILLCQPFGLSSILLQSDNKDHLQVTLYLSRLLNTTEQDTHN